MADETSARLSLREGMHFQGISGSGHQVSMESPPFGGAGASPMEMVLMALAGCSGMDVIAILRKKRQQVADFEVLARGQRCEGHPKVYTAIQLEFVVSGKDIAPNAVEQAIELSRKMYCPIWAMLGDKVDISYTYHIVEG